MIRCRCAMSRISLRVIFVSIVLVGIAGCRGAPIRNEYPEVTTKITAPSETRGVGKVVIVNESLAVFSGRSIGTLDVLDRDLDKALGIGFVDIYIGGKSFKKLDVGEYAQVFLPYGTHQVEVDHKDIMGSRSRHELEVSKPWTFVVVYPRPLSNRFDVIDSPPQGALERLIEAK